MECANKAICGNKGASQCEHFDISYTRTEIIEMLDTASEQQKTTILDAIASVYRIKLAF